jgi:MYXO-CTERM domain-containing protein
MLNRFLLASALLGLSSSPAFAGTFYMSNAGNDNAPGSSTAPWATLGKANAAMTAGDTLYLRGGVYSGVSGIHWTKSGTVNSPVVISAYPGEHPVFNGNGANALMTTGSQYTIIDGLEVTNYDLWAFDVASGSSYVTIRNCYLHNIHGAENAALVTSQSHHVTIENCVFEEMGRSLDQIKFDHAVYNSGGSHDVIIRNNYFRNNYGGPAINNYHPPDPYNIYIYNNVFVMTKGTERSAIYAGTFGNNVYVYNNTFYLDGTGATTTYGVSLRSGAGDVVENNIFYFKNSNVQSALVASSGNAVDYNLFYPTKDSDDTGIHSLDGDPLFKTPGSDFHLTEPSPARKGAIAVSIFSNDFDTTPRPAGAWDMGAFQYGAGTAADAGGVTDGSASDRMNVVDVPPEADGAGTLGASGPATGPPDAKMPVDRPIADGDDAQPTQATADSAGCNCNSARSGAAPLPLVLALTAIGFGGRRRRQRSGNVCLQPIE